ncbi:2-methoxy-6-polyprenyl-1,4-benzoquinol methylase, mitochondrial [Thelohanellus kitauei]|uniref:2-methoxy-6-polyprenyl-1,4-benzoquinol methylase, mitochondrial n=1 Tax=Thelohanellus kitauei TaxID=669202 RepID=A0A0C2IYT3_THEKT|nr:2-methoxy-6-polyprenyl-1,4-benzoquinol methylase, mitochondrial [Thelohanellus kitauei]
MLLLRRTVRLLRFESTHFGFKEVDLDQKQIEVDSVFTRVAKKYDLMNDLMSFYQHRCWKNQFVGQLNPKYDQSVLDLAAGTGDIAFRVADKMAIDWKQRGEQKPFRIDHKGRIVASDINADMLEVAKKRAQTLGIQGFEWLVADSSKLPLDSNTFDAVTISFGLRNCPEPEKVLTEALRVLKPNGRFMCLEFSKPKNKYISKYGIYFNVIPIMGEVIASDWNAYRYLVESIRVWHTKEDLCHLMIKMGFSRVSAEELSFGIVCIHQGFKNSNSK